MMSSSVTIQLRLLGLCCIMSWGVLPGRAANDLPSVDGVFNVMAYGAVGDGTNRDTAALQRAVDASAARGGGRVVLPAGRTFLSGAIRLRDNVDLHLARGACLKASDNWRDYGAEGALLFAKDATGISVTGDGVIDGNDRAVWQRLADEEAGGDVLKTNWWPQAFCGEWWPFWRKPGETPLPRGRPRLVLLIGCQQVRLRDITLRSAPSWTVHLAGCEDVVVESISIRNAWDVANNDGIDLDHCRNVRVANCLVDCADDGIVIKNTPNFAAYGGSEHITVTGCIVASRSAALKVDEIYSPPGARDIIFADCVVTRSNRGLCIQSRDEGNIENVLFANIVVETQFQPHKWWGAAEPIHLSHYPRTPQTKLGVVRHIRFSNILCRSENGAFLHGWKSCPLEDIVFDHVRLEVGRTTDVPGGFYDLRPAGEFKGIVETRLAGIYCRYVRGLALTHTQVDWGQTPAKFYGDALDKMHVRGFHHDHFSYKAN
jgi:polygalacturonase